MASDHTNSGFLAGTQAGWPTNPFYIRSGIGDKYNLLTAARGDDGRPALDSSQRLYTADTLWIALQSGITTPASDMSVALLVNLATGLALDIPVAPGTGAPYEGTQVLALRPIDPQRPGQQWRISRVSKTASQVFLGYESDACWWGSSRFSNTIQVQNSAPYPGYPAKDVWSNSFSLVEDPGEIVITGWSPDIPANTMADSVVVEGSTYMITTGSAEVTQEIALSYTDISSSSYTSSHGQTLSREIAARLKAGGTIAEVIDIGADLTVKTSTATTESITTATTEERPTSKTYTTTVTCTPHTANVFSVSSSGGSISGIRYQIAAEFHSSIPGVGKYPITLKGDYSGTIVNGLSISVTSTSTVPDDDKAPDTRSIVIPLPRQAVPAVLR